MVWLVQFLRTSFLDCLSDFIKFEFKLQIRPERHRRYGHSNFQDRLDRRSDSINFLPI